MIRKVSYESQERREKQVLAALNANGIQSLHNSTSWKNLCCHSCGVSHTGTSDCLNQCFLNDTFLNIQAQLTGTLLWCTPANAVC